MESHCREAAGVMKWIDWTAMDGVATCVLLAAADSLLAAGEN